MMSTVTPCWRCSCTYATASPAEQETRERANVRVASRVEFSCSTARLPHGKFYFRVADRVLLSRAFPRQS